jgi:pilus assembly protein Flp/PilA
MRRPLSRFVNDDSAATAIEYALIIAFISLALVVVVQDTGFMLAGTFARLSSALGNGWNVTAVP